jgi:hypothetical protein
MEKGKKIVIGFKKRNYQKGKAGLLESIAREISRTSYGKNKKRIAFNKKDFRIVTSDANSSISFANASVYYFSDMYAIKVYAAPRGKSLYYSYEIGKNYMIELPMTCFAIKTINGDNLETAIKKLRK